MERKPIITTKDGEDLFLVAYDYSINERLYLGLETIDGELYSDITVNLPEADDLLPSNTCIFLSGDMQTETFNQLYDKGIFSDVLYEQQYNMGRYKMVQLFPCAMKEYLNENDYVKYFEEYETEM